MKSERPGPAETFLSGGNNHRAADRRYKYKVKQDSIIPVRYTEMTIVDESALHPCSIVRCSNSMERKLDGFPNHGLRSRVERARVLQLASVRFNISNSIMISCAFLELLASSRCKSTVAMHSC